jgi:anaerobic dimethyl sulfoxide reductase subunit A
MSKENFITEALNETVLSRRTFLKWSGALGGAVALTGGIDFGLQAARTPLQEESLPSDKGQWMTAACWHNCGGRCVNKALVVDGIVVRQKTDDTHPDSPDFPQQRGCARGRSQRQQVFGADRIKYPMKRKNWEPGGGKRELRGVDEWVRISWDEALDIVASELKRIQKEYGQASIFTPRFESALLNFWGGSMSSWGVSSEGAWPQVQAAMAGGAGANDRMDYRNTRLLVFFGSNPSVSSAGNPTYNYRQAKEAGAKVIFVDPYYNQSAQSLADEWIPVRPGTDAALLIGMAYHMITNDLQDQEFLDKYTLGFDAEHMPDGADPKENFKDYVLGTYDGVPKTPEWASEICGTAPDTIRKFALEVATTKPMMWQSSWAPARTHRGQQMGQAFFTVGWMTGNVGKSGAHVTPTAHSGASYGGASLVRSGGSGAPRHANPLAGGVSLGYGFAAPENTEFNGMAYEEMWDAVLNGEYHATVRGVVPCNIQMIYIVRGGSGSNSLNQVAGINKGIDAFRKVEFVVSNDIVLSTVSKYADVVLPATTLWEKEYGGFLGLNSEGLLFYDQITEPLFEAMDENWMEREIASRLGLDPDELNPLSQAQMVLNQLAGATVITDDGSGYEPLVTLTKADIAEFEGAEAEPQQGRISYKEYRERGVYQVPRAPNDAYGSIAKQAFIEDPEANPLSTASGKLEIHSQALSDKIAAYGFTDLPPVAQYIAPVEGVEATYEDWDLKKKGEYPLQLYTIHYHRRSHSVFDNITQLREAFPQEFIMNPIDAEERGLKHNDQVLITSQHGQVIRPLAVSPTMMPGVVTLSEGAWVQRDDETGIDHAGATNSLNGVHLTGQGEEPWNTCVVQVEKWTGEPIAPDAEWPQRVIFDVPTDFIVGGGMQNG